MGHCLLLKTLLLVGNLIIVLTYSFYYWMLLEDKPTVAFPIGMLLQSKCYFHLETYSNLYFQVLLLGISLLEKGIEPGTSEWNLKALTDLSN